MNHARRRVTFSVVFNHSGKPPITLKAVMHARAPRDGHPLNLRSLPC